MANNRYEFTTRWQIPGTIEEVSEVLSDALDLPRWWPSVYLGVDEIEHGEVSGVGRVIHLYTKGWLPYTLQWDFRVTEANRPYGFAIEAWGDFVGTGVWTFEQQGPDAIVVYDWRISAEKALLRRFSFVFKPIFKMNHEWAMRMGEESLLLEMQRRHAADEVERAAVPPPPGPTKVPVRKALGLFGLVGAIGVGVGVMKRRRA